MPALPALPDLSGDFYLPLAEGTARRLATNMLSGKYAAEYTATDLLLDPALVCWTLCRTRTAESPTLESLARWINEHNWIQAFSADIKPLSIANNFNGGEQQAQCRRLAKKALKRALRATGAATDSSQTVAALTKDAVQWFKVIGVNVDKKQPLPASMPTLKYSKHRRADRPKVASIQKAALAEMWASESNWALFARPFASALSRADRLERRFEVTLNQEKLKAIRELAYGASHEINNPLANISTRAQMLMRDEPDPDRKRSIANIAHQAFRAHEMITDLMLFAKPPEVALRSTALGSVLKQCRNELLEEFHQPGNVTWRIDSSCKKYEVLADRSALTIALKAIFQNSLEALEDDGTILVRASMEKYGDTVSVRISDSGPGIPESMRRRIFDPFFSGREAGRGLGFGLPKAWQIIRQHGGQLTLETAKNRTEFVARLKSANSLD